jgi:hypothetical protein
LIQWPARPAKNDSRQTSLVLDRFHQEWDHQHVAVQLTNRKNVENVLGLLSLANVVARAVLTAPGPLNLIHAEVPNRMIGTFPFMLSRHFSFHWRWYCTFWLSGRSPATPERRSTLP